MFLWVAGCLTTYGKVCPSDKIEFGFAINSSIEKMAKILSVLCRTTTRGVILQHGLFALSDFQFLVGVKIHFLATLKSALE